MSSIQYWFVQPDHPQGGVFLTVEYIYTPAMRGLREKYGVPITPDDPAEVEIIGIHDDAGAEYELPDAVMDVIVGDCFEDAERRRCDAASERAERESEYIRERRN